LRKRDPKNIYRRFEAGELRDVAGLDLSIDEPSSADLVVEFVPGQTVDSVADIFFNQLKKKTS
jgi:adenylylsulfate kinase-like enzyme